MTAQRSRIRGCGRRPGFTLVELLIVVTIIVILTAVAIPTILPAIESRKVSEAARVFQAQVMAVRDAATRAGAPRGLRLLPDPAFLGPQSGDPFRPLAYNRIVPLEAPPDHRDGLITVPAGMGLNGAVANMEMPSSLAAALQAPMAKALIIIEQKYHTISVPSVGELPIPNPPTNWYGKIRQGDKIYIPSLRRYFNVAGPVPRLINGELNTERLIGVDVSSWPAVNPHYDRTVAPQYPASPLGAGTWPPLTSNSGWTGYAGYNMRWPEFLIVTNGIDDDSDGFVDEHFDGIDNNLDTYVDPAFDGENQGGAYVDSPVDRLYVGVAGAEPEWEDDADLGLMSLSDDPLTPGATKGHEYRIIRRPVPAQGSAELTLPGDVLIDATTASSIYTGIVGGNSYVGSNSRSRLPINPAPPHYVDFMIAPNGQVIQAVAASNQVQPMEFPFLHFWLAERADILPGYVDPQYRVKVPVTKDALNFDANYPANSFLTKGRRLVSVFSRTGQVVSNSVESFNVANPNLPFIAPQRGARETQ